MFWVHTDPLGLFAITWWAVIDCFRSLWVVVGFFLFIWVVVDFFGSHWVVVEGCGWLWIVLVVKNRACLRELVHPTVPGRHRTRNLSWPG